MHAESDRGTFFFFLQEVTGPVPQSDLSDLPGRGTLYIGIPYMVPRRYLAAPPPTAPLIARVPQSVLTVEFQRGTL